MVTKQQIIRWLEMSSDTFQQYQDQLTDLDREIGDADHGLNMNRGFQKVKEKLPTVADKDIATVLKTTGMALLSSIGGASGPLYGTFFIRAASCTANKESLTLEEMTVMFQQGIDGIIQRGKANLGDKTMIDVWSAILLSLQNAHLTESADDAIIHALNAALVEAKIALESTIPMQAKKGRASYLGERSIGHQDPGATSTYYLFDNFVKAVSL